MIFPMVTEALKADEKAWKYKKRCHVSSAKNLVLGWILDLYWCVGSDCYWELR